MRASHAKDARSICVGCAHVTCATNASEKRLLQEILVESRACHEFSNANIVHLPRAKFTKQARDIREANV
jgi:hypothetical protein